jgi:hypothetical protein
MDKNHMWYQLCNRHARPWVYVVSSWTGATRCSS